MNKREVIFQICDKYRMVCRFGYSHIVPTAWWGYLQQEITYKPWPWSIPTKKWCEIDYCWWDRAINSMDELKKCSMDFYDEKVEMPQRIINKAMSL